MCEICTEKRLASFEIARTKGLDDLLKTYSELVLIANPYLRPDDLQEPIYMLIKIIIDRGIVSELSNETIADEMISGFEAFNKQIMETMQETEIRH